MEELELKLNIYFVKTNSILNGKDVRRKMKQRNKDLMIYDYLFQVMNSKKKKKC